MDKTINSALSLAHFVQATLLYITTEYGALNEPLSQDTKLKCARNLPNDGLTTSVEKVRGVGPGTLDAIDERTRNNAFAVPISLRCK